VCTLSNYFDLCGFAPTQLGGFASIAEVGIGLYLALAILQAVSSGGVADLRRKAALLREAIVANKMRGLFEESRRLKGLVASLELGLLNINKLIFKVVFGLIIIALIGLIAITIFPQVQLDCLQTIMLIGYFSVAPFVVFLFSALVIRIKCKDTRQAHSNVERKFLDALGKVAD